MNYDELIAQAEIGEEARRFVASDLGKTLMGLAEQQALSALEDLAHADPADTEAIRKLQNKVRLGRDFAGWLLELIQDGDNAMEIFKDATK